MSNRMDQFGFVRLAILVPGDRFEELKFLELLQGPSPRKYGCVEASYVRERRSSDRLRGSDRLARVRLHT